MKKILKGLGLTVLALFIASIGAIFFLTHDWSQPKVGSDQTSPTFTDNSGNAYNVVVDTNGVTFAVVADESQNIWQVEIKPDGSLGETVASLNDYFSPSDVLTTNSDGIINENVDPNQYAGDAKKVKAKEEESTTDVVRVSDVFSNHPENTTQSDEVTEQTPSTTVPANEEAAAPKELYFEKYRKMFSDGTYYMKFTTSDDSLGDTPIVAAKKGNNILVTTTIEEMTGTVIYIGDKDKTYFVVDEWKQYFSLPKKFLGEEVDMKDLDLLSGFFSNEIDSGKFKSETVEINGKVLTRESYVTKGGTTRGYYFDDGTLVRIDSTDENGETSTFYISSITNNVPDSIFEIPSGYRYLNLSWLL